MKIANILNRGIVDTFHVRASHYYRPLHSEHGRGRQSSAVKASSQRQNAAMIHQRRP